MAQKYSVFSYKSGNSFLHKMPSWIKIIIIPILNILFLCLHPYFSIGLLIFQFILACFLRFTIKEQLKDLKPVLYYAVLLFLFAIISETVQISLNSEKLSFLEEVKLVLKNAFLNEESIFMLIKLFCLMQSTSLIFKTSTSLEIREGIGKIESAIRKIFHLNSKLTLTNTISLFVTFIPMVAKIWEQSKKAWKARQGKSGAKMYITLLPVLFSVGMKSAYNSAKAILAREK